MDIWRKYGENTRGNIRENYVKCLKTHRGNTEIIQVGYKGNKSAIQGKCKEYTGNNLGKINKKYGSPK